MQAEPTLSVAWYREDQWQRLRELAADRDKLAATHAGWQATAEKMWNDLRGMGQQLQRIDVDVEMLWAWCCAHGRPLDGAARAEYAANRARDAARRCGP